MRHTDGKSHIVGLLNPNELGIYDMGGNVQEWVQDWYGHYPGKAQKNPKVAKKSDIGKIIRGGCFSNLPQYNKP
ncbi:MAG: SUMF1/EgtB/PvdO family nonheme iron enzyme [Porphyromonadaceae bacterium]|nr:SUMF1/EgtB/PvdO family nonheme iron enzyme [Porphyromonadaceae bacterium]